ncbi:MAG TPA: aldehyde dehydrogenase family protein [Solirubrobacterales bacterium]
MPGRVPVREWGAFVDGAWLSRGPRETYTVVEPATAEPLAEVAECRDVDVDLAVASARRAAAEWRLLSPKERAGYLRQVAERIRAHADELAELEAREVGKPRADALRFDVTFSHTSFDYFASLAHVLHGEIIDQSPIETSVVREPYGVVAAVLPFNWPPIHFAKKGAPALMAGNTVVIKPGEQAPLTVLRLVEIANQVLPPGVLNAVTGIAAGAALCAHPGVDRISFTGSSATGRRVLAGAAEPLTYATLELGGKNALIVLDDADLDRALAVALEGMFYNQGEACTSTARILVHEDVHDEFLERFTAAVARLRVGDGLDSETHIGPMVDARQRDTVMGYIEAGLEDGARIVFQGEVPGEERLRDGYWVPCTVFADVGAEMRIAQEEIFGPVACVMRFGSDEEAVAIANGTQYGLTAAICTGDKARAWRLARRLDAGMVFVNNYFRRALLGAPFGGMKASGFGRENSPESLLELTQAKAVRFHAEDQELPLWPAAEQVLS